SERVSRKLIREPHTRVCTNGEELWQQLKCREGRIVVSSCIYRNEMAPRASVNLGNPPRILFVGYIRPEKGCNILIDAFELLRRERDLRLTFVGDCDRKTGAGNELKERIGKSPFLQDIEMRGMVDFGDE